MMAMLNFTLLVVLTMFAVAAAAALAWICLRLAFVLMQPSTAGRVPDRTELVHGTARLARALVSNCAEGTGRE